MNAIADAFVPALGWALVDFLWQGLLLGLLMLPLLGLLRGARPQARYALLLVGLLACVLLPLAGLLRGLDAPGATAAPMQASPFVTPQLLDDGGSAPVQAWQAQWQGSLPSIVAAWALGASLLALRFALGLSWVMRTRQHGALPGFEWQARLERLSAAMGLANPPNLRLVEGLYGPIVAGWWRPVVLLPAALVARMPAELLEALLAHELAHVRRHDYLVNLLQGAVEALLFYHPVVWWLSRQVRLERELIADDLASRAIGQPRPLALALQQLERLQAGLDHPVLQAHLAPAAHGGHLMNRIKRLIRPTPSSLHWKSGLPLLGVAALCLAVYAQATPRTSGASRSSAILAPVAASAADDAVAPVAPIAPSAAVDAVAAEAAVDPVDAVDAEAAAAAQARANDGVVQFLDDGREPPYALVREHQDTLLLSGNSRDREEVRRLRQQVHGDFLWFRKDGQGYLIQDPALVAEAAKAWAPAQDLGEKMQDLGDRMAPHSRQMEALARQMQAIAESDAPQRRQIEAASAQMQPLAERQQLLAEQMKGLSVEMIQAGREVDRERLQRDMDRLQQQMEPLNRQMSELGERLGEQARRLQSQHVPMQQLSEQMQRSSEPMQRLGEKLSVLAKQQESLSHQADAQVKQVIEQALREGKARPGAR